MERIRARVPELVPDVEVVGDPVRRLPHLVTFSCLYVDGETLLHELDRAGFSVSSGSSCTCSTLTPSHVLQAMGVLSRGQRPGVAAAGHRRRRTSSGSSAVLPGVVRGGAGAAGRAAPSAAAAPPAPAAERPALVVDSLGKRCPIPVIELAKVIGEVPVGGDGDACSSDDEAARLDIPAWCAMRGQEYVG